MLSGGPRLAAPFGPLYFDGAEDIEVALELRVDDSRNVPFWSYRGGLHSKAPTLENTKIRVIFYQNPNSFSQKSENVTGTDDVTGAWHLSRSEGL